MAAQSCNGGRWDVDLHMRLMDRRERTRLRERFYWQGSPSWKLAESFCRQALLQSGCNCRVCAGSESCSVSACPVG